MKHAIKQLIDELMQNNCSVELNDNGNINLVLRGKVELPEELVASIRKNKYELVEYLRVSSQKADLQIEKTAPQESYSISNAQRRLWVLSQFENSSAAYNMPSSVVLEKGIDIESFKQAIDATLERHEILRTVFKEDEAGEIRQWVLKREDLGLKIDYIDLRKDQNKRDKVEAYIEADSYKAFDLENGPLLRMSLFHVENNSYIFYYNIHHIIADGWSSGVLSRDVLAFYEAYKSKKQPQLKELKIQYKDYSAWQLAQLAENAFKVHRAYWMESLSGELPLIDLPGAKQRPLLRTNNGHRLATHIDKVLTQKLRKYSETNRGSLFMSLLAVWNVLLYRYTSQTDIIIGTPIAGREHADLEDQIGFYVNTLALRNEIKPEESFNDFYKTLRDKTLESYSHQAYPFDRLVEDLDLQADTGRNAVFDILLTLQNNGEKTDPDSETISMSEEELNQVKDLGQRPSIFDIDITFEEIEDYLSFHVLYNPDVYLGEMIERLIIHYKQLLIKIIERPQEKISKIDYLCEEEKHKLLVTFNNAGVEYRGNNTVLDLFETQVKLRPGRVAIIFEEKELTYEELDTLSNQLAQYLQKNYRIRPDDLIGVKLERSEWIIISILSVLKAGGAYVPIDLEYPRERIKYIESDISCKVCIDENELKRFKADQQFYSKKKPLSQISANNLAYVIYTSGTTGNPKGVMIEHRSLFDYACTFIERFKVSETDKCIQQASFSFDIHVEEIYPILCKGGSVLMTRNGARDLEELKQCIELKAATILSTTPLVLRELNTQPLNIASLRLMISGGDLLNISHIDSFIGKSTIYNSYGPSESTVCCTYYKIEPGGFTSLIGSPITNRHLYIVDSYGQLVPVGITGEICICGAGLARGYFKQEILTKEKFIDNPFKPGERLYKTGDLGRWLNDGNIEFIGRKDSQVKIRGFRIELGEIESALLKNDRIEAAIVLARESQEHEKELVAYITATSEQNTNDLRSFLKKILPEYMLPAYYVQLESLPLTSNGKIDKKALPDPRVLGLPGGIEYVAPRNEMEERIVKIWQKVLQRENIGVRDDFFSLGGHSLKAVRLGNEYQKQLDIKMSLKDLIVYTTIEAHAEFISALGRSEFIHIAKLPVQESYAISDAQRRLWVLNQFEDRSVAYNMPDNYYLNEDIDIDCFRRAIDASIDRHEILRTVFKEDDKGQVRQWILKREDLGFKIDYKDHRKEKNKEALVNAYISEDAYKAFDLENGPLLRAALFRVEDDSYFFYFNMHHIISDRWSMEVLSRDILSYHEAFKNKTLPQLKELRIQYKDYAAWQLTQLEEDVFNTHRAYWLDSLSGELPRLDLPGIKQRPRVKTNSGHGLSVYIDQVISGKLKKYSQENGGSLFMGLMAVWNVLVYRYTSHTDIITGSPVVGRGHADLEDQIGFYLNTLALRIRIDPEDNFNELFSKVRQTILNAYSHHRYPFDKLVEELKPERDTSRSAVFDILLTLQNDDGRLTEGLDPIAIGLREGELSKITDRGYHASKFDLDLTFKETGNYLTLHLAYNPDVYEQRMVEGLLIHYRQLLYALLERPEEKISQINYLSEAEKHELLVAFNNTAVEYPLNKTIVDLFEEQVAKNADNIAVVFEEKELSYHHLDKLSNQLAHYLQKTYYILPNDLVGIKLERSEWMVISLLAVLKLGAAYVPIDPGYPLERIEYIERDAKCKVCLNEEELKRFKENANAYPLEKVISSVNADHVAYVIYTSGSTGHPKGVIITHANVVNIQRGWVEKYGLDQIQINLLQMASMAFDVFMGDMCRSILTGGKAILCPSDLRIDPKGLYDIILKHKVSIVEGLPEILLPVMDYLASTDREVDFLKLVIFGSDILSGIAYKRIKERFNDRIRIINSYGTTETTIDSSYYEEENGKNNTNDIVPIGKPFPNVNMVILDAKNQLVPKGVTGEICIGGAGVAKGYLNQDILTSERFIGNPFKAGERLYKTGDLGKWLDDGNIEFIGRKDDQVKIRGYRIELGEIEQALQRHKEIRTVIVLAKEDQNKEKELVAYFTANSKQNKSGLRTYLKETLPEYMLPVYYVQVEALPLTPNGKIDRNALPDPRTMDVPSGIEHVAPRNEIETKLSGIWRSILQKESISVKDDFFTLGGHSLKAIRLANEYQKQLSVKLSLKDLFMNTSIESHAGLIMASGKSDFIQIEKLPAQESYVISDAQRRLWVLSQFEGGSEAYNMPDSVNLNEDIDIICFKRAIESTLERHEVLRTVFKEDGTGEVRQWILRREELDFKIVCKDFSGEKDKKGKVKEYIENDSGLPFDLEKGPLLRCALLQVEEDRYVFYFNIHHIISDGWSMEILAKDVLHYHDAYKESKEVALKPLRIQYKDYAAWSLSQLEKQEYQAHRRYWLECLNGELPVLDLPGSKPRPGVRTANGKELSAYIDKAVSNKLKKYSLEKGGSLFIGLLATWNALMYRYTYKTDIITGSPVVGREHGDLENQIGFYVNTMALRNEVDPNADFDDLFLKAKQNTLNAYTHQMYPFDRLVEELDLERDTSRSAIFDVMLVLQNNGDHKKGNELEVDALERIEDLGSRPSKFDISITFYETDNYLSLHLVYNTDIYERETVERLIKHYKQLLNKLSENPLEKISRIDYISEEEKLQLKGFNVVEPYFPSEKNIIELIRSRSVTNHEKIALKDKSQSISYAELESRSNEIAYTLLSMGLEKEELVSVIAERSADLVSSILGIWKAGGAYVPIDPSYPIDRIGMILNKSCSRHVFVSSGSFESCKEGLCNTGVRHIHIIGGGVTSRESEWIRLYNVLLQEAKPQNYRLSDKLKDKWHNAWELVDQLSKIGLCIEDKVEQALVMSMLRYHKKSFELIPKGLEGSALISCLKDKGIDGIITSQGNFNSMDKVLWRTGLEKLIVLTDDFKYRSEVENVKAVWDYTAENSTYEINDYGWINSFNGEAFSKEEMQEYIDNFKYKLSPYLDDTTKLLEIGTGHGLLLRELSPLVESYFGTDLSEVIIEKNKNWSNANGFGNVRFECCAADSLSIFKEGNFDIVVCSSVAHYFPNNLYFERVIEEAINKLNDRGIIYLDDLLDLDKKQEFKAELESYKYAHPEQKVSNAIDNHLFISRDFVNYLKERFPEIKDIEFSRKRGYIENELTKYRFDLLLRVHKNDARGTIRRKSKYFLWQEIKKEDILEVSCKEEIRRENPQQPSVDPDSLSYVIFTSGSTGKPKGVMIEHLGMLNHIGSKVVELGMDGESRVAQNAPSTFDISVWQMFGGLVSGGTTLIYEKETILEPSIFISRLEEDKVSVLELVPSYLTELLEVLEQEDHRRLFTGLKILVLNAETLMPSMVKRWLALYPDIPIVNTYGITETSDDLSHYVMKSVPAMETVPVLRRPIQHCGVHIVDAHLNLVPVGVKGEILVSGVAVGRGYINDADRTKEVFLQGPLEGITAHKRIYRTGDIGRYLSDGTLEFFGRKDTQVKIRGHRIECGEIEHVLMEMEGIVNCKVVANVEKQYLVGYYQVREKGLGLDEVQGYVGKKLPGYMVPHYFVEMERFPLNANGKIDSGLLPDPEKGGQPAGREYIAPRNEMEERLMKIWEVILQKEDIGIKDNFFTLGGHSLKAMRLSNEYQKQLGVKLSLNDLFTHTNIESQADLINIRNWIKTDPTQRDTEQGNINTFDF